MPSVGTCWTIGASSPPRKVGVAYPSWVLAWLPPPIALKFQWEEKAQHLTSYPNFWKQFYRKFPQYREATVTAREFVGGERVEVDWAGDPLEWVDFKSGEIRKAWVFVAGLGFSQLLFARATEDMKSRSWLGCHRRMYAYFGGVPHIHRHKMLRVKLTENQVEIFLQLERLAVHPRSRHKNGRRVRIDTHFPPASQAYYEATPQKLLSQSRFIHPQLHELFVEWFNADVYGHIRRCQGFLRRCTKEIEQSGHELASDRIVAAIGAMRRHNRIRVPYFQAYLDQLRRQAIPVQAQEPLVRRPGNPMLRYATHALATEPQHITSENSDP